MGQLLRCTCEHRISYVPSVWIIYVAPCFILYGVICNTIIPDKNVNKGDMKNASGQW